MREMPRWLPVIVLLELLLGLTAAIFPAHLPFLLLIGFTAFLIFLVKPEWGYCLIILALGFDGISLLTYLPPGVPGRGTVNAHHFLILITMVALSVKIVRDRVAVQRTGLEGPLFLFFAWMAISCFWVPSARGGVILVLRVLVALSFFFSGIQLFREAKSISLLIGVWFALGLADTMLTFLFPHGFKFSPFVGVEWARSAAGRARAFTNHPNTLATHLNLAIMLGLGLLFAAKSRGAKWLYAFAIAAMCFALVLTMSRGWIAALPIGAAFFFYKMRQLRRFICVSLIGGVAVAGFLFLVKPEVGEMFLWRFFRAPPEAVFSEIEVGRAVKSINVRSELWKVGLELFKSTYGLGIGAGGFAGLVGRVLPERADQQLHSLYLTVIFELGIVGVVLFLWLLISFQRKVNEFSGQIRGSPMEPLFFSWYAGWVTLLFNGILRITPGSPPFWGFMSLGIIIIKVGLDKKEGRRRKQGIGIPQDNPEVHFERWAGVRQG